MTSGSSGVQSSVDDDVGVRAERGPSTAPPTCEHLAHVLGLARRSTPGGRRRRRRARPASRCRAGRRRCRPPRSPRWSTSSPSSYSHGVLAEVPDVAVEVLGVPVVGVLDEHPVDGDGVADDDGASMPIDLAGLVEDDDLDVLDLAVGLALVDPARARRERQVRVVDDGDEVRRVDVGLRSRRRRPGR